MTLGLDSQNLESYLPVYDVAPKNWDEARAFIVEQLKAQANAINAREIGFYLDQELLTGKSFIPGVNNVSDGGTSQTFRSILRKVIDFGPLPAFGVKRVPHGITFDANFTLISMVGSATDPTNLSALPLPYVDVNNVNNQIAMNMDSTYVNIALLVDRSSFTRTFITLEYIQEL